MVHQNRGHHVFNPKRILFSLLLVLLLSIGALFTSYKSIQVGSTNHPQARNNKFLNEGLRLQKPQKKTIPNYYNPKTELDAQKYWSLSSSNGALNCKIQTTPTDPKSVPEKDTRSLLGKRGHREQYVIHIHGLHHTGTGYLRQTIQEALNDEFASEKESPVATLHNGELPHLQGLTERRYIVPENEGQHFQNVFPPFRYRSKLFMESKCSLIDTGRLAYLADECTISNTDNTQDSTSQLGNILFDEWSTFWNTSATFLIQKTPLLDVKFHEVMKQLPTLHIIIVRHPYTSNAWRFPWAGIAWLDSFSHTFDLLAKNQVDWYAVVSYEALIHYHDKVVEELIEVVKSGMKRFGSKIVRERRGNLKSRRRRLHLHSSNATATGPLAYLVPKDESIKLWERCLRIPNCRSLLNDLTKLCERNFGFVNMDWADIGESLEDNELEEEGEGPLDLSDEASEDEKDKDYVSSEDGEEERHSSPQLSSRPGLVSVRYEFSHVLFTSEGNSLREFWKHANLTGDHHIGINPSSELVSTMNNILAKYQKTFPTKKKASPKTNTAAYKNERYWTLDVSDGTAEINCEIFTKPVIASPPKDRRDLKATALQSSSTAPQNQYVIHIHGLHHSGTGYTRQTLHDSIDRLWPGSSSMHDYSLYPYIYGTTGRKISVPENEGQHLQTMYPSFAHRAKLKLGYNLGRYAYLTDFCRVQGGHEGYHEIGELLQNQWSRFWNTSATFLLQKTPTLDVRFLELTKVMPTLHVLVVRHPMTSNSWTSKWMGLGWLDAWYHTLEVLALGQIEWYAVVTYEALIQYHETVVEELMEVVRSGMNRLGDTSKLFSNDRMFNRRLELHKRNSAAFYLKPKSSSISLWKSCNIISSCGKLLTVMSSDMLPMFGYVDAASNTPRGKDENKLSSVPGPKGISEEYGHVLFSSEGDALQKLREKRGGADTNLGNHPPTAVTSAMKKLLLSFKKSKPKTHGR